MDNILEGFLQDLGFMRDESYIDVYTNVKNQRLKVIFSTIYANLIKLFKNLNTRIPQDTPTHYWAEDSRQLFQIINIAFNLQKQLEKTELQFQIENTYAEVFKKCQEFLQQSGGSQIPVGFKRVEILYADPIFISSHTLIIKTPQKTFNYPLQYLASGSYADVYKYRDSFYNRDFVLKLDLPPEKTAS